MRNDRKWACFHRQVSARLSLSVKEGLTAYQTDSKRLCVCMCVCVCTCVLPWIYFYVKKTLS